MSRLVDRLSKRTLLLPDPQGVQMLSQSWVMQDYERIVQTYLSYVVAGYGSNSVVFSTVLARLQMLAQADFKYLNRTTRKLFGDQSLSILENPWPNGTSADLIAKMEQHNSIAGNAFVRREGDRLIVMRPDWVDILSTHTPNGDWDELNERPGVHNTVIGYLYSEGGRGVGDAEFYPVEQVAHWSPIPDPLTRWRGMSWMTPVLREINADTAMTEHRQAFFTTNAGTPNVALKYAGKVAPNTLDEIKQRWNSRIAGPNNAGSMLVLDAGADLQVVGSSFEAMRFTDLQAAGEARIAAAAGVPPILAGLQSGLDASAWGMVKQEAQWFADNTCSYLWTTLCSALAKLVDVPQGAILSFDTKNIPALRQDQIERANAMQIQSAAISTLLTSGFDADSAVAAVQAGDLDLLKHTGLVSVQLYKAAAKDDAALDISKIPVDPLPVGTPPKLPDA